MKEVDRERRRHPDDCGRRWDDRLLRVLRSIDASLKVIAANFQPGDKLESQVMIFGAAKSK